MQSLRPRRPFTHTSNSDSDSDSDSSPTALDEQEQEALIQSLTHQNDARNAQFRLFLLALPLVSAIPYLLALTQLQLQPHSNNNSNNNNNRIRALLSLTSLAATAWTLWALPPGTTGIREVDSWASNTSTSGGDGDGGYDGRNRKESDKSKRNQNQPERYNNAVNTPFRGERRRSSPLAAYLPYLNVGLCAVLVLAGLVSKPDASAEGPQQKWGHVGLSNLPAVVYGVVVIAKIVMGGVDPERDLSALRYDYKGA
ncbi:hypothetical protein GL218_00094 [Daldinia childiae]|uniref:uncharacterized protein n=1 Tax=Daldinia childiae TaxID=326645 RepID=UPI00144771A2|nr:uncharacterized protein GL218_00094 [Daldinia childiae]KAF3070597.1 hypothetical protein GL218_00094 [Daldinia childiae]